MVEAEVRGTAGMLVRSWRRGEEVGGVTVAVVVAEERRLLAGEVAAAAAIRAAWPRLPAAGNRKRKALLDAPE